MKDFDLISIGDSTVDIFLEVDPEEAVGVCNLNEEKCVVEFEYGAKIPVNKLTRVAAVGNASNNAIGSSRLGLKTAIYTVTGSDSDSLASKEVFEHEDVDTSLMVFESDKRSNFSTVINYSAERNIFVYHEERKYDISKLPKADWAYFTSVGRGHEILHEQIPTYVKNNGVKLGYNPGSFELREGIEVLKPILAVTEALIVNREEAQSLVKGDLEDIKGLLGKLKETGPKMVVITDGRGGSYASCDGHEVWFAGIPEKSPVIERTGCGDAYSTGFLSAIMQNLPLPDAMVWGTMNATSVIQYIGAREGLLTRRGIDEFKGKYGSFVKPQMI